MQETEIEWVTLCGVDDRTQADAAEQNNSSLSNKVP